MFCTKCGTENKDTSKYCRKCGVPLRKPREPAPVTSTQTKPVASTTEPVDTTPPTEITTRPQPNVAGPLCYLLGWLTGVAFLFIEKKDNFVRFHAWQSIVTFGILTIPLIILNSLPLLGGILHQSLMVIYWLIFVLTIALWVFLMLRAYLGQAYKLPVAGDIAQRLLARGLGVPAIHLSVSIGDN
jgi:uncharacterized membrane protein